MFTGLIQSVGKIHPRGNSVSVKGCSPFEPICLGDSISVDGVCLTVTELVPGGFIADISEETLTRTTLGLKSKRGGHVNLEPAIRLSDRLGGHLVSGHVDGLGEVISIEQTKSAWALKVALMDSSFSRFICDKASIALNGISLTIAGCYKNGEEFWIAVIPHTWTNTSLKYLSVGELVNFEVDLMAKYVESLLRLTSDNPFHKSNISESISNDWLKSHGWH